MVRERIAEADPKMDKALEHLREDLKSLRTGRASTAIVDSLMIENYGQMVNVRTVATLGTPDAHTIAITPWDRTLVPVIEKAIREAQSLGLNPVNDGNTIRLNVPPMTEERRRDIVKSLGEKVEACHIAMRNVRHEILNDIKKMERDKQATADDVKFAEQQLNTKIEQYRGKVEEVAKAKEVEIMEV